MYTATFVSHLAIRMERRVLFHVRQLPAFDTYNTLNAEHLIGIRVKLPTCLYIMALIMHQSQAHASLMNMQEARSCKLQDTDHNYDFPAEVLIKNSLG
ncbi:hypothetical protein BABINDRAFT_162593 [Babjeviella inositovora NRRL Y-12698]|uniref:Uncharacterized protein n=1 Tax=Babjeviella inositovora NRRL Y-12698 TaxID=984486 RepID=A0A1E3QMJ7_9ASCO|nr:uncharacterized protein BABINDRAFT_162593 [Babjeviella inositovora NRRL Y-12698]ODQ78936.1 hypothetical protein BABINDRAFT_162593 [Babjeviella inositovora NRRL Y-12698]